MLLYLMQHGEAKSKEEDPDRPLTDEGRANTQKAARFARGAGVRIEAIRHSGKTRAAQTAEGVAQVIAGPAPAAQEGLGPTDDVGPVAEEIASAGKDVLVVGHMPFLGRLAGRLLTGDASAEPVAFQNAGMVCLAREPDGPWQVRWMVTPDLLP